MCLIDYHNKIIFIAIPKTGTTSTEVFLKKKFFQIITE